ncbi:MAG: lycopene cyclase domain-containing protein [Actinobacteria bacterium]|jgi:lycopene cyclase domain-containing protein|nr:lycopene cyclase domain-containing protein [Actinomycetota bacterium]
MTYTQFALLAVLVSVLNDRFVLRTRLTSKKSFWNAYGIMVFFQLLTNWWPTSRGIFIYDERFITGFRIAAAPVEDLFFGFSMILLSISLWIFWGRRGIQRD